MCVWINVCLFVLLLMEKYIYVCLFAFFFTISFIVD